MDPQETTLFTAIIIAGVVLGIIILFFAISIVSQQRRNLELSKQAILAELNAMEKERSRIAQDLHDDVGPILSVVKFQVDSVVPPSEDDAIQLKAASQHLDLLIDRMREIAKDLMPSALIRKGLIASIEEFAQNVTSSTGVEVVFSHSSDSPNISKEKSLNIYRLLQESVHNSLKHAGATRIDIELQIQGSSLILLCRDNGSGFDYQATLQESSGLGLRSLKGRIEIMGGTLKAESKKGVGTAYLYSIPI